MLLKITHHEGISGNLFVNYGVEETDNCNGVSVIVASLEGRLRDHSGTCCYIIAALGDALDSVVTFPLVVTCHVCSFFPTRYLGYPLRWVGY